MDINWSKAPAGATHYCIDGASGTAWRDLSGVSAKYWSEGKWHDHYGISSEFCLKYGVFEARPTQNGWNGEGLPPVGAYIEWLSGQYGWLGGRVVGHDGAVTVVSHNDGYTGCHPHEVRAIRTPEQIAAEERAEAVAAMLGLFGETDSRDTYLMQRLYDAGYRKQENN